MKLIPEKGVKSTHADVQAVLEAFKYSPHTIVKVTDYDNQYCSPYSVISSLCAGIRLGGFAMKLVRRYNDVYLVKENNHET